MATATTATVSAPPARSALSASALPRRRAPRTTGKQTLLRAVRAEWLKIRTLRSTWITSLLAIALTVLFGAGIAVGYAHAPGKEAAAAHVIGAGSTFGQIAVAVLGALVVTGEYSSGRIRSSLAAVPHRGRLLVAKALVIAVWSFLTGVAAMLLTWAISAPMMDGHALPLTDTHYLGYFWGVGLSYAAFALMAMGLGHLLRSTAGAVTVVMTLLFVIDIPLQLMSRQWDWAVTLQGLEPATVALAVQDPFALRQMWGYPGTVAFLEQWQAVLVFGAWFLLPVIAGWIVFTRRDA